MQNVDVKVRQIDFYNKRLIPTLAAIAFALGIFTGIIFIKSVETLGKDPFEEETSDDNQSRSNSNNTNNGYYDSEYINEIFELYENEYLGDTEIDTNEATQGMVKGFIESLDDKYTYYLDPEEAESYYDQASGDFEGIGVILEFEDEYTYVETVLREHPAEKAGVIPGDIIVKVDGEDVASKYPSEVAQKIRGEKGTDVVLSIVRVENGVGKEMELTITRDRIEIDNVMWEKIDDKTVLIEIVQFSDVSATKFNESWDAIVAEIKEEYPEVDNVIVDLRNNPGGYVFSVRYVLEEFLRTGDILLKERSKLKSESVYRDNRPGFFEDTEIFVLVNEGSASASEIFAGAIQDHERGVVIGMPTVGKGVEQQVHELEDKSLLFLVFQEWLTPDGRKITEEEPIKPDYEVDYTEENFKANEDPQLDKAKELIGD